MSLSRSPSPGPGGGWASPGLNLNSGRSSPTTTTSRSHYFDQGDGSSGTSWEAARVRASSKKTSFSTHNQGFFTRHMRRISNSLPKFNVPNHYADKEKLGRGRLEAALRRIPLYTRVQSLLGRLSRKNKIRLAILTLLITCVIIVYNTCKFLPLHRLSSLAAGGELCRLANAASTPFPL